MLCDQNAWKEKINKKHRTGNDIREGSCVDLHLTFYDEMKLVKKVKCHAV